MTIAVWRRSWIRRPSSPAASVAGPQMRFRNHRVPVRAAAGRRAPAHARATAASTGHADAPCRLLLRGPGRHLGHRRLLGTAPVPSHAVLPGRDAEARPTVSPARVHRPDGPAELERRQRGRVHPRHLPASGPAPAPRWPYPLGSDALPPGRAPQLQAAAENGGHLRLLTLHSCSTHHRVRLGRQTCPRAPGPARPAAAALGAVRGRQVRGQAHQPDHDSYTALAARVGANRATLAVARKLVRRATMCCASSATRRSRRPDGCVLAWRPSQ
jgi:hypothetical protein